MPKVTIEYYLPGEQEEYNMANDASAMWCVIVGMREWLRDKVKYGPLEAEKEAIYLEVRQHLEGLLEEYQVREHP